MWSRSRPISQLQIDVAVAEKVFVLLEAVLLMKMVDQIVCV